jgi:peptidyl-prolyl cis-trans isomerase D
MFQALKYNLKNHRRHMVKSATAVFIFGAIIVVFIGWGMNPRNQGVAEGGAAAVVNDATISLAEFSESMERMRRDPRFEQLQALGGDATRQIMQRQALSQLIDFELIHQAAQAQNVIASDAEVRDIILDIPQFKEDGVFKASMYHRVLDAERKTPSEFEESIRRQQALRRVVKMFTVALSPLKLEQEKSKALKNMKANLEFVSVPTESLVIPESIPMAEVKAFVAKEGSEAKIKDYFESHKADFNSAEKVKARHILIRAKAGDADAEKKALKKIQEIAERAKKEDFGKLASQLSEDPGSKAKGGLLDFFTRGRMVPEFENAAFSQKPNEIGEPVKTEYGYHLIQVLEKKPAVTRNLDEVKEEIAQILLGKERSRVAIEALQESLKKADAAAVQKFVGEHKLKWEETGAFAIDTDNVPKVGANEEVVRVGFQLSSAKPLASNLVREGGRALILRYKAVPVAKADAKAESKIDTSEMMSEMTSGQRAEDSLRKWLEETRKSAKISTNPRLS